MTNSEARKRHEPPATTTADEKMIEAWCLLSEAVADVRGDGTQTRATIRAAQAVLVAALEMNQGH